MKTNVGSLLEKSDEQTRRRMREMLDNVDTQIGHMNRSMQSAAQRSRDQMREFSEQSRRRMQLAARRSRDQARRSARDIDRFAHDNTWAVVSAAAVGGAILGALLTSRLGSDHRSQYGSWRHDEHDWSDDDLD
ncbi:MAG: hypothetical protein R3E87_00155 [Burkholderiaceae bacterium]